MRQKNREVSNREELLEIMRRCDVCRLALNNEGYPYIVPMNFGLSMKLDLIRKDNRASFEMDGKHQLQYFEEQGYCTMAYESVIGSGTIRFLSDKEKEQALRALMDQYHPGKNAYFNPAAISRTAVYVLEVESITGKRKLPK